MYNFSKRSLDNLKNVDERLVLICNELIKRIDFTVIEGHRSIERQQELYKKGLSQLDGIIKKGNHNFSPSRAIDIIPYKKGHNPFDGTKESDLMFNELANEFKKVAIELGININWGGDWKSFIDKPHFELK